MKLSDHAARSMILPDGFSARVCHPSTLRMVICPEASSAQKSKAAARTGSSTAKEDRAVHRASPPCQPRHTADGVPRALQAGAIATPGPEFQYYYGFAGKESVMQRVLRYAKSGDVHI